MYLPAIVCVASWFEERRAIAVSIAVCGSGVGTFIFNPLTTFLIDYYGLFGCRLILAGIAIQGKGFVLLVNGWLVALILMKNTWRVTIGCIYWSIDALLDRLVDSSFDWLIGWLIISIGSSHNLNSRWLIDWFIYSLYLFFSIFHWWIFCVPSPFRCRVLRSSAYSATAPWRSPRRAAVSHPDASPARPATNRHDDPGPALD